MQELWYITGPDAIDIARMSGVQLRKVPCKANEPADTSWQVADAAVAAGEDPECFYVDLNRLSTQEAGDIIMALLGGFKAYADAAEDAIAESLARDRG